MVRLIVTVGLYAFLLDERRALAVTALAVVMSAGLHGWSQDASWTVTLGWAGMLAVIGGSIAVLRGRPRGLVRALTESEARFRAIADASPSAIFFYDAQMNINYANPAAVAMTGLSVDEIMQHGWERALHPDDLPRLRAGLTEALSKGLGYAAAGRFVHGDGRVVWWEGTAAGIEVDSGDLGYLSVVRDVTDERALALELQRKHRLLHDAERVADIGSWSYDPATGESEWSSNMFTLLGVTSDSAPTSDALLDSVDVEDHETVVGVMLAAREAALGHEPFEAVFEFRTTGDGPSRWMQGHAQASVSDGRPMMMGTVQDVTSRKLMEDALRESRALLQSVLDNSPARVVIKDPDGRFLFLNGASVAAVGLPAEHFLGRTVWEVLPASVAEEVWNKDVEVLRSGESSRSREVVVIDDEPAILSVLRFPIRDEEGAINGICTVTSDITQEASRDEIRARERRQIAVELHDDAVQVMAAVALHLDTLDLRHADEAQQARLAALGSAVRDAVARLREVMSDLADDSLETHGLADALQGLVDEWRPRTTVSLSVDASGNAEGMSLAVKMALFQVAREALANAIKHSRASKVAIVLEQNDDDIHLTVADDGTGFDFHHGSPPGHFGLTNMTARVAHIGGTITIGSAGPAGTLVDVHAPAAAVAGSGPLIA